MTTTPPEQDATYWKERYEAERVRVMKLWVAYQTLELELEKARQPAAAPGGPQGALITPDAG